MKNEKLSMEELGRMSVEEYKLSQKTPVTVILDNVRSMNNIGSMFRTCDAFRIEKIFLCGITATPPNREINKTALGATESVDWQYAEDAVECIKSLKAKGYTVLSSEQTTDSIFLQDYSVKGQTPLALVFGNEVEGVQQEIIDLSDAVLEIPQFGTKHSFNVSVTCGIVLWELVKQLKFRSA
ncbi:MAG: RNA methyltransferase [Bacteroidales bacterium]|nr:RNA methyltransferase [Bacteroidales bacterium]